MKYFFGLIVISVVVFLGVMDEKIRNTRLEGLVVREIIFEGEGANKIQNAVFGKMQYRGAVLNDTGTIIKGVITAKLLKENQRSVCRVVGQMAGDLGISCYQVMDIPYDVSQYDSISRIVSDYADIVADLLCSDFEEQWKAKSAKR